jgi:hypothetical protein
MWLLVLIPLALVLIPLALALALLIFVVAAAAAVRAIADAMPWLLVLVGVWLLVKAQRGERGPWSPCERRGEGTARADAEARADAVSPAGAAAAPPRSQTAARAAHRRPGQGRADPA